MATLTETAYYTRKTIKYGSIGLAIFLILRFLWIVASDYWIKTHPAPPPTPTVAFGKLPPLSFPAQENLPNLSFKLETIEGTAPKLSDVSRVYFMPKPVASLLALERAKELALKLGFRGEPESLSERLYRFTGEQTGVILEIDTVSQNFKLLYDFEHDQSLLNEKKLPYEDQAVSEAKTFLQQAGLLNDDLKEAVTKITFYRLEAPSLLPVISLSEADFVRVDLFRASLDDWKIMPPNPNEALVNFLISGSRETGKRIVQANFAHRQIAKENFATYPLKSSTSAWQELIKGKGYIASLGENSEGSITVRKVYLAYYESESVQDFLQPIFVFTGDKGFIAYVQAVDSQWSPWIE